MPDLIIASELRDAIVGLIARGRFPDDPAANILGAVAQLNGLAPANAQAVPPSPAVEPKRRARPRRGLSAVPDAATPTSAGTDAGSTG